MAVKVWVITGKEPHLTKAEGVESTELDVGEENYTYHFKPND